MKTTAPESIGTPSSILVIATRRLGDVLLITPLLHSIRQAWPNTVVDVIVNEHTGGILEGNPDINEVIEIAEHPDWRQYLRLLKRITRRYDLAVTTQAGDRPHLYSIIAAATRVGIISDLSWKNAWKRRACNGWALLDNVTTHTVHQNLKLAEILGIGKHYAVVPPVSGEPEFSTAAKSGVRPESPYAVVHPYPMWRYKRWTTQGWEQLIEALLREGLSVVITGGPDQDERRFCAALTDRYRDKVMDSSGKLRFGELSALLASSTCFIGPDTSITHLAAASGTPTVALYGPTNPVKWGPWPASWASDANPFVMRQHPWQRCGNVTLVQGIADCVPCHEEGCERHRQSYSRCLDDLPAELVIEALREILPGKQAAT
jgi:heptosyltransferase-3